MSSSIASSDFNLKVLARYRALPGVVSLVVAAGGAAVLSIWLFRIEALQHSIPDFMLPRANTALLFVLSGAALWLMSQTSPRRRAAAVILAVAITLLGAMSLSQDLFNWNLGIDQILAPDNLTPAGAAPPGRVSPAGALCFVLSGGAFLTIRLKPKKMFYPAEWLCVAVQIIALAALLGYLFGIERLYHIENYSAISLTAVVLFLLLPFGILCLEPEQGGIGLLSGKYSGSAIARRVLPLVIGIFIALGILNTEAVRLGLFDHHFGEAALIASTVVVSTIIMLTSARSLNAADKEIRDFSAQLEQRVAERTAQLEASKSELDGFSYNVSHDLRAPLRAIDGFSRILEEDYASNLDGEGLRFLGIVRENVRQMGVLIDDLLAFARLGRKSIKRQRVDMMHVIHQVIANMGADNGNIEFQIGELPVAEADPDLTRQVVGQLLSNAMKFSRHAKPPRIEVGHEVQDGQTVYFVRDNGVGFDMQYALKLFGMFQRLHRAEDYEGTGVGLAIVHRIIEGHGGRIWADSEVGKGATFFFTIGAGDS